MSYLDDEFENQIYDDYINRKPNKKVMENNEEMISLFDYLKKPAGAEGQKVYAKAKELKIKCDNTPVQNSKFTGNVMTYPKSFLDNYFKVTPQEDDLPF